MEATKWLISYQITFDNNRQITTGNFFTWNTDGTKIKMNYDEAKRQINIYLSNNSVIPQEFRPTCNIIVLGWSVEED